MTRLYANENFPRPAVDELRRLGHDVLTSQEAGNAGRSVADAEVLRFAVGEQRAVLTLNRRHFVALHRRDTRHSGIIVCTFDPNFVALATRIHVALTSDAGIDGALIRLTAEAKLPSRFLVVSGTGG